MDNSEAPAVARIVPPAGADRRAWIRYELGKVENPETGRRWTQADVAREAFTTDAHASLIFTGERGNPGPKADKIRRITARVLGLTTDELFGVALEGGDGYPGSPSVAGAAAPAAETSTADQAPGGV